MRIALVGLLATVSISLGCTTAQNPQTSAQERREHSDLFAKKLQCSNFLSKVENSITGPQRPNPPGVLPLTPVAFYSRKLNTCVLVTRYLYRGGNQAGRGFASVDDLLTGKNIEVRFFDMKTESKELNEFADTIMRKYEAP